MPNHAHAESLRAGKVPPSSKGELRTHWRVLVAAVLGNALASTTLTFYTVGIFGPALQKDYGWSTSFIFSGFLIWTLTTLFSGPVAGRLADRYGVRTVVTSSALMLSPALMAFTLIGGSPFLYAAVWAVIAIVGAGTTPVTWSRAINNHFEKHKGLALGISLVGTGLMAAVLKPLAFWLVVNWGWQGCFIGLSFFPLVSAAVGWVLLASRPEKTGDVRVAVAANHRGISLKCAVGTLHFWQMLIGIALIAIVVGGMLPHVETIVAKIGFSGRELLAIVSVLGIATAFGRLSSAYLIDRFWAPAVAALFLFVASAVMLLIPAMPLELAFGIAAIAVIGATAGMEIDVAAFMVSRYFGYRSYSTIYGVVFGVYSVSVALGSIAFGAVLESASLSTVLNISSALLFSGAIALLSMGRYRFPAGEKECVLKCYDSEMQADSSNPVSVDPSRYGRG